MNLFYPQIPQISQIKKLVFDKIKKPAHQAGFCYLRKSAKSADKI